jgi:hypothetical protein
MYRTGRNEDPKLEEIGKCDSRLDFAGQDGEGIRQNKTCQNQTQDSAGTADTQDTVDINRTRRK